MSISQEQFELLKSEVNDLRSKLDHLSEGVFDTISCKRLFISDLIKNEFRMILATNQTGNPEIWFVDNDGRPRFVIGLTKNGPALVRWIKSDGSQAGEFKFPNMDTSL